METRDWLAMIDIAVRLGDISPQEGLGELWLAYGSLDEEEKILWREVIEEIGCYCTQHLAKG